MRPRPPLPGPVASESLRMTMTDREALQMAADHGMGNHGLPRPDCPYCAKEGVS